MSEGSAVPRRSALSITDRFAAMAASHGTRTALRCGEASLSYALLDDRSTQAAHGLIAAGVGPGDRVLLALDRSMDAIVAMLAVLKCRAVFVPIDATAPQDYRLRIQEKARAACILTHDAWPHAATLGAVPVPLCHIDDKAWLDAQPATALPAESSPDDAAYVMFTSGSTGNPKGVVAPHRGVTRLVVDPDFITIQPDDVFLLLAPMSFDASTLEIWGALLNGATLAIMPPGPAGLDDIAAAIQRYGVSILWLTAGLFHLMVDEKPEALVDLRWLLAGGDVLQPDHARHAARLLRQGRLVNGYGPTENTTFSACHLVVAPEAGAPAADVPIGRAIAGTTTHVLDADLRPVTPGEPGELHVGGLGLALGYLDDPQATIRAFIAWPPGLDDSRLPPGAPRLLYRTGDLVREDDEGVLHFLGRRDDQIKIGGHRVELAGIRQAVAEASGATSVEIVLRQSGRRKELWGFVVASRTGWSEVTLRRSLARHLPAASVPTRLVALDSLPLGLTGKVDRKALIALAETLAAPALADGPDAQDAASLIAGVWARHLGRSDVPHDVNFFDLGGTSLDLIAVQADLDEIFPGQFSLTDLFARPSVAAQAAKLTGASPVPASSRPAAPPARPGAIAIIGMAGRFPGAASPQAFWRNLADGVESIGHFPVEEIEDALGRTLKDDPRYVRARAMLADIAGFDAGFFGFLPREADVTDPQQRLFLEIAWEAFEDAGYDPQNVPGAVGVFAGASVGTYLINNVLSDPAERRAFTGSYQTGAFQALTGNGSDFLATRIAYKLDLRGPAMTVQSACSTSLLAVAQACASLRDGTSDMALAGGVSITVPQKRGYLHQAGGMVSADGHCRPFDADSDGTVFGNGAGAVLLKRLDDALADGDHVYAVILGAGITNDGAAKVGYAAPSVAGQAEAIARAHQAAGVTPDSISYVECHGTATPLGDPIEVAALTDAFRRGTDRQGFCALGTAKSNIGHLDVAAGVTGLIKTALSFQHRALPPLLHWRRLNPAIDFAASPFTINAEYRPWTSEGPRRAGVSAFGVGGTNVHLVLEEAPAAELMTGGGEGPTLIQLSARSPDALHDARLRLADHIEAHGEQNLADVAYTLRYGRRGFRRRAAFVAPAGDKGRAVLVAALRAGGDSALGDAGRPGAGSGGGVAFLFPGQGAQHPGMGAGLYRRYAVYRKALDDCAALLQPLLGIDLRRLMLAAPDDADAATLLRETRHAQPALFATSWSLAQLWHSFGIEPTAMIGHSVGELVAACLAGIMSFEDALRFVAARGAAMQAMVPGRMLTVRLSAERLERRLVAGIDIAAINGPTNCVVAGPDTVIEGFEAMLSEMGVVCRPLRTSHAFHSAMMEPAVAALRPLTAKLTLSAPRRPIVSTVTGTWLEPSQATDPDYWARHVRVPVRFADALATLNAAGQPARALIEVGASRVLSSLARQQRPKDAGEAEAMRPIVNSLADPADGIDDQQCLLSALGRIWADGHALDWSALGDAPGRRVPLPTYPFQRRRHWVEPMVDRAPANAAIVSLPQSLQESQPMQAAAAIRADAIDVSPSQTREAAILAGLDKAVAGLLEEVSGVDMAGSDPGLNFLELGFDSLLLTQITQAVRGRFGIEIAFRQLSTDIVSPRALAAHIRANAAASVLDALAPAPVAAPVAMPAPVALPAATMAGGDAIQQLMRDQLAAFQGLMQAQLAALGSVAPAAQAAPVRVEAPPAVEPAKVAHGPYEPFETNRLQLTPAQATFIAGLVQRNVARTPGSKRIAQAHRAVLADPRVAAGYRLDWKEMVYPLATTRSAGSKLWDVDGNAYIDLLNGFGPTAFGHAPDFVRRALAAQIEEGFEIGPMTPLAGEAAQLIQDLTGNERVTFCNTGSEAVMAAMRVARTVTGRMKIATFSGDYHGQFDEVLVKGFVRDGKPLVSPIAPGIPKESVSNMVLLEHNAPASLAWLREHAHELAAVLIEPKQSRHPGADTRDFLHELRAITEASGTCFILDEIVTGFRLHPGGAQALFDLRADLVTYGKVVGGGMPIGVLAGKARFMDALDGGAWNYGDESGPTAGVTFFAGTFVRHPLSLAACIAVLRHLKEQGPALQAGLNARADALVARLNRVLTQAQAPVQIENFGSVMYFKFPADNRFGGLFWYLLREKGVHHQEGFPAFLTTAHDEADIERIVEAFAYAAGALRDAGCFGEVAAPLKLPVTAETLPVVMSGRPTEAQMEIWLASQFGPAISCAFNESVSLVLHGVLDSAALARAIDRLVGRHDALRLRFSRTGERFEILPEAQAALEIENLDALPNHGRAGRFSSLVAREAETAFDLVRGPLIRFVLAEGLAPDTSALIITAHHIVCDGWSINVMAGELGRLYEAEWKRTQPALEPAPSFAAYAGLPATSDAGQAEAYWLALYASRPEPLELPSDRPRPMEKSYRGGTCRLEIDRTRLASLKRAGAKRGATLFSVLLAGFATLIARLSGQHDLVIGVPTAAQSALAPRGLVGHCVNFLPLRLDVAAEASFASLVAGAKSALLAGYEHQACTFGTLVRRLGMERAPDRLPLVDVQFNLEKLGDDIHFPGLDASIDANPKRFVNFDLFLNAAEAPDRLVLDCDYNADLFDAATIKRWLGYLDTLLDAAAADMDRPAASLPLMSGAERRSVLKALRGPEVVAQAMTVHGLIEAQAARSPKALAVRCGDRHVSYADLNAAADRLADRLGALGVIEGQPVGVMLDRSVDLIVGLLGVMKLGAFYVPLDPANPLSRTEFVIGDSGMAVTIANAATVSVLGRAITATGKPLRIIDIAEDRRPVSVRGYPSGKPGDLAYRIYTSGSTGKPKGVDIEQRALVNLLLAMREAPGFEASDTMLAVTTPSFDIAALELFLPLISGGTLAIAQGPDIRDGRLLIQALKATGASIMQATPATWWMMLEAGWEPDAAFKMLCGGEPLSQALAARLIGGGAQLWNMYGPTETTVWSIVERVVDTARIDFGRPIANTRCHVLDERLEPVPMGVPGELCIAGLGLARGYHRRDDLTAEKFVTPGFEGAERLYRTGDRAVLRPDGRLILLGRTDDQIKLRGFRIELGEIEAVLHRVSGRQCAVRLARPEGREPFLVAYVEGGLAEPDGADRLREALGRELPSWMVPAQIMTLESLPRTANNKLDRKALPVPITRASRRVTPPRTPLEQKLLQIWQHVLGQSDIGVTDPLFSLGADSIQAFRIVALADREGLEFDASQLLRLRTIEALAEHLVASIPKPSPGQAAEAAGTPRRTAGPAIQRVTRETYRVDTAAQEASL